MSFPIFIEFWEHSTQTILMGLEVVCAWPRAIYDLTNPGIVRPNVLQDEFVVNWSLSYQEISEILRSNDLRTLGEFRQP